MTIIKDWFSCLTGQYQFVESVIRERGFNDDSRSIHSLPGIVDVQEVMVDIEVSGIRSMRIL